MTTFPSEPRCTVTVVRGDGGRTEVHKRTASPARRERLVREAATLRRARHPGVVDLVELHTADDGSTVLVTRLAGAHTLATWASPSLEEIAGVLVALGETLADLHHLGLFHGAVEADHVVLDIGGRPVLCGFDRSSEHRSADDVAGLGRLTRRLLEAHDEAIARDERPARRGTRRRSAVRHRLLDLADQATDPDHHARPGARRFAAAIVAAVPDAIIASGPAAATTPLLEIETAGDGDDSEGSDEVGAAGGHHQDQDQDQDPEEDRAGRRTASVVPRPDRGDGARPIARVRRGAYTAAGILGLASMVFGGLSAWNGERPELSASPLGTPAPVDLGSPRALGTDPSTPGETPAPPTSCIGTPMPCASVAPGGVVDHAGSRFALGDPADELLLAEPRCPDPPAVILLRPDDGSTYWFDRWAVPGEDIAPRPGPSVAPGSRWVSRPLDERGCAPAVVLQPDGRLVTLEPDLGPSPPTSGPHPPTTGAANAIPPVTHPTDPTDPSAARGATP